MTGGDRIDLCLRRQLAPGWDTQMVSVYQAVRKALHYDRSFEPGATELEAASRERALPVEDHGLEGFLPLPPDGMECVPGVDLCV